MHADDYEQGTHDGQRGGTIKLHGTVVSGSREAASFTELPWVKKQFIDKLGIYAVPGTFNLMVPPEDEEKLETIRNAPGIEITPENEGYCPAKAFPAIVGGRVRGAAIIPLVPNYAHAQLEIISSCHIRQALALKEGDEVGVEVELPQAITISNFPFM